VRARLVLGLVVAALAAASPAAAVTFPNQERVTGPQLVASLNAGLGYWAGLGRAPRCPSGIVTYLADLPAGPGGLHAGGSATVGGCEIWLDRAWIATLTAPAPLCPLITHELGHLIGFQDGGTGNPVMDAGTLDHVPPIPECVAAFPPSAPVAAPLPLVPQRPPRLTRTVLRTEARRALRAQTGRSTRPFGCKLLSRLRGSCRAKRPGRRCRGHVVVRMSESGGVTALADVRCVRKLS